MRFFRKKEKSKSEKNDFNPFDLISIIKYYKSKNKNATQKDMLKFFQDLARPDDDQTHLTEDGLFPFGWFTANKEFTDKIQSEYIHFYNNWLSASKSSPLEKYAALKSLVIYLRDARDLCYSKDECFAYWFDGSISDQIYIDKLEKELKHLEENRFQLQDEWEKRQENIKNLDDKIIKALMDTEGILQSDFVKLFDPQIHDDVKEKLYFMAKSGKIERIKSGRSYILKLK